MISQYPISVENYDYAAEVLLQIKDYDKAYYYLTRRNEIGQSAFSDKWLGIIDLYKNRIPSAKEYLNESLKYNDRDAQVWYNLTGVYIDEKDYQKALQTIEKTISLQPNFPGALALREQLQKAVK